MKDAKNHSCRGWLSVNPALDELMSFCCCFRASDCRCFDVSYVTARSDGFTAETGSRSSPIARQAALASFYLSLPEDRLRFRSVCVCRGVVSLYSLS